MPGFEAVLRKLPHPQELVCWLESLRFEAVWGTDVLEKAAAAHLSMLFSGMLFWGWLFA